jgi:hypothetical protein
MPPRRQGIRERSMLREFTKALREVWRLSVPGGGAYRPDLHYMRGPGPKWQAKYGNLYPKTQPANPASGTSLRDLAGRGA